MHLDFDGMLLSARTGEGDRGAWTALEFSPSGASTFTVFANDKLDMSAYLRKEMSWSLGVTIGRNGKVYVGKVTGSAIKAK